MKEIHSSQRRTSLRLHQISPTQGRLHSHTSLENYELDKYYTTAPPLKRPRNTMDPSIPPSERRNKGQELWLHHLLCIKMGHRCYGRKRYDKRQLHFYTLRKKCADLLVQRNYNSPTTQHRALVTHPNCPYADTPPPICPTQSTKLSASWTRCKPRRCLP